MQIACLDLEGVLIPEIWIQVAERFKMESLRVTTRDIPDYDKLMRMRLGILRKAGIRLADIQKVIQKVEPLPGAKQFLDQLRDRVPVIILSDTYYEFAASLMKKLGQPVLFCNGLKTDRKGFISNYVLRQKDGKTKAVRALKNIGFRIHATGDSYNDVGMLKNADHAVFFNPPASISKKFPKIPVAKNYPELLRHLTGSKS